jgi:hypothetical protein
MKGYIYTMFKGADPSQGWNLTDPIYGRVPTLGACMPNIRRLVEKGDFIFTISGQVVGASQYIVGGFEVEEKISALAAFKRLPGNRQKKMSDGTLRGNIIVDKNGKRVETDYHANFEKRVENYVIGKNPVVIETPKEVEIARAETADILADVFQVEKSQKASEMIGRWRKLDGEQIELMRERILEIKKNARL